MFYLFFKSDNRSQHCRLLRQTLQQFSRETTSLSEFWPPPSEKYPQNLQRWAQVVFLCVCVCVSLSWKGKSFPWYDGYLGEVSCVGVPDAIADVGKDGNGENVTVACFPPFMGDLVNVLGRHEPDENNGLSCHQEPANLFCSRVASASFCSAACWKTALRCFKWIKMLLSDFDIWDY